MQEQTTRPASAELRIGEDFAGHRIEKVLGRGGMGVVYQATDLRLNRPCALKVITPTLSSDPDFRRRFQRESELAASVRQQNVVTIFQAGEFGGLLFVTMELVPGMDLRALLTERGRLDPQTACAILTQLAAALDAAHASGLVHRDVKPGNVLIAGHAPLHVYLTDFGLTKKAGSQSGITKTGLFVGTIDYAAPEQIKGWPVDARADVYALGCVLFEMLAGAPPFRRDNEYATMYAHTSEPPPAVSAAAPGLPAALDGVIARALAKEPDGRYPSAGDLARAAEAAIAGQTIVAPERTVAIGPAAPATAVQGHPVYGYGLEPETTVLPRPRRRWLPYALIALVLAIAGAVVVVASGPDSTSKPPPVVKGGPTVDDGVAQIASILDLSQQGRTLTLNGQYSKAIANRQQVLDKLDALKLAPRLETSRTLLRQAVEASLNADQALLECETCASTATANKKATDLKQRFVVEFNPYATRYVHRSFDPSSF